jgi:hypothetical protein
MKWKSTPYPSEMELHSAVYCSIFQERPILFRHNKAYDIIGPLVNRTGSSSSPTVGELIFPACAMTRLLRVSNKFVTRNSESKRDVSLQNDVYCWNCVSSSTSDEAWLLRYQGPSMMVLVRYIERLELKYSGSKSPIDAWLCSCQKDLPKIASHLHCSLCICWGSRCKIFV